MTDVAHILPDPSSDASPDMFGGGNDWTILEYSCDNCRTSIDLLAHSLITCKCAECGVQYNVCAVCILNSKVCPQGYGCDNSRISK